MVPARIQSKSKFRPPHSTMLGSSFLLCSPDSSRFILPWCRRLEHANNDCSVTLTPRSKMVLSAVVKHKRGASARHHLLQPHHLHTQSNRNFNKPMQLLTVIQPPHLYRVASRCSPSVCRTGCPCTLPHRRRLRNSAHHVIQAVQPTRRQHQQRPRCIRCEHRLRRLSLKRIWSKPLGMSQSLACLQLHYSACRISRGTSPTQRIFRIKSANRSSWV
jgi:hypothetical protein